MWHLLPVVSQQTYLCLAYCEILKEPYVNLQAVSPYYTSFEWQTLIVMPTCWRSRTKQAKYNHIMSATITRDHIQMQPRMMSTIMPYSNKLNILSCTYHTDREQLYVHVFSDASQNIHPLQSVVASMILLVLIPWLHQIGFHWIS